MKIFNKFLISTFILLGLLSCDDNDFLEQTNPDELNSSSFWRNATDAKQGLTAAYSELETRSNFWNGWQEGRPVVEYYRSDYSLPGPDASNYAHWMQVFNFTYTNEHPFVNVYWYTNYRGINFANQVITKVAEISAENITEAERKQFIGEATFLRGYYHFKLLTIFDQIITRTEIVSGSNLDKALATRAEAWQIVINDFTQAATMLKNKANTEAGRATTGAALAYLGKAYMYKAGDAEAAESTDFQNAVDAFKQIIDSGDYSLVSDYFSLFNGENENNAESVFELQFKSGDATSWNATRLHAFIGDWSIGGWGGLEATKALETTMKSEGMVANNGLYDNRLYGTLYFRDDYYNDTSNPRMQGYTWDQLMDWQYGNNNENKVYYRKWLPNFVYNNSYIGLNVTLMRYADVLLMYAEALNETGNTAEAISIINNIRDVHGLMPAITASSQADVKQQIIHERTMELSLESVRFFDLRRWGMLDQAMQAAGRANFSTAQHAYFPVPLSEINNNNLVN